MTGKANPKNTSTIIGIPVFFDDEVDSDPGVEITLTAPVVPIGKIRALHSFYLSCGFSGVVKIKNGSTLIASGHTGPANRNFSFFWVPGRDFAAGQVLTITYKANSAAPIQPIRYHLMVADRNA